MTTWQEISVILDAIAETIQAVPPGPDSVPFATRAQWFQLQDAVWPGLRKKLLRFCNGGKLPALTVAEGYYLSPILDQTWLLVDQWSRERGLFPPGDRKRMLRWVLVTLTEECMAGIVATPLPD